MLARIRKAQENEGGFTLIELLVVVIIIGILSAIAIPTFLNQREKGWDKAARSDLRNNAIKVEEYLDDAVPSVVPTTAQATAFKSSDNVGPTTVELGSGAALGYCLENVSTKIVDATPANNVGGFRAYHYLSKVGKPEVGPCPAALP